MDRKNLLKKISSIFFDEVEIQEELKVEKVQEIAEKSSKAVVDPPDSGNQIFQAINFLFVVNFPQIYIKYYIINLLQRIRFK